jgi:hypothetical protein
LRYRSRWARRQNAFCRRDRRLDQEPARHSVAGADSAAKAGHHAVTRDALPDRGPRRSSLPADVPQRIQDAGAAVRMIDGSSANGTHANAHRRARGDVHRPLGFHRRDDCSAATSCGLKAQVAWVRIRSIFPNALEYVAGSNRVEWYFAASPPGSLLRMLPVDRFCRPGLRASPAWRWMPSDRHLGSHVDAGGL